MKKIVYSIFVLTLVFMLFQASTSKVMRKEGAEPGYTGSPGDSMKNCTACHGGDATFYEGWIESNIPSTGYVPGQIYTITTTNTELEGTRFGFQISPQNDKGDLLGEIIVTDSIQTQLVGGKKYLTYTENGVDGKDGSKTWTFNWKAPEAGTGKVTFYGAYNSNFQGHKGSDHTFLSTLILNEHGTVKVSEMPKVLTVFSVYPNPSSQVVNINLTLKKTSNVVLDITDSYGKTIANIVNEKLSGNVSKQYNTSQLASGIYFIKANVNGSVVTQKLTVKN